MTEAEAERILDARIQRRLRTDRGAIRRLYEALGELELIGIYKR